MKRKRKREGTSSIEHRALNIEHRGKKKTLSSRQATVNGRSAVCPRFCRWSPSSVEGNHVKPTEARMGHVRGRKGWFFSFFSARFCGVVRRRRWRKWLP